MTGRPLTDTGKGKRKTGAEREYGLLSLLVVYHPVHPPSQRSLLKGLRHGGLGVNGDRARPSGRRQKRRRVSRDKGAQPPSVSWQPRRKPFRGKLPLQAREGREERTKAAHSKKGDPSTCQADTRHQKGRLANKQKSLNGNVVEV